MNKHLKRILAGFVGLFIMGLLFFIVMLPVFLASYFNNMNFLWLLILTLGIPVSYSMGINMKIED